MAHTFEALKKMKVSELREVAVAEGIEGSSQMNKEHLLEKICTDLKIDMHVHHEVVGLNKAEIKKRIKEYKLKRDELIAEKNYKELKEIRNKIKRCKKKLRNAMV